MPSDESPSAEADHPTVRCQTDGCRRETEFVLFVGEDADGNLFGEDTPVRSYCHPCRLAAESADPWHPGDRSFRRVDPR